MRTNKKTGTRPVFFIPNVRVISLHCVQALIARKSYLIHFHLATMQIQLNGQTTNFTSQSISELLQQLSLTTQKIAVERNGDIIPRSLHAQTILVEGDVIEIITAVGGG